MYSEQPGHGALVVHNLGHLLPGLQQRLVVLRVLLGERGHRRLELGHLVRPDLLDLDITESWGERAVAARAGQHTWENRISLVTLASRWFSFLAESMS